jgi:hypothetical protein
MLGRGGRLVNEVEDEARTPPTTPGGALTSNVPFLVIG